VYAAEVLEGSEHLGSREAGQLSALLAAISTCIGTMHMWCMPCTQSVKHPEWGRHTLGSVRVDLNVCCVPFSLQTAFLDVAASSCQCLLFHFLRAFTANLVQIMAYYPGHYTMYKRLYFV
jgi:hypothetical protein